METIYMIFLVGNAVISIPWLVASLVFFLFIHPRFSGLPSIKPGQAINRWRNKLTAASHIALSTFLLLAPLAVAPKLPCIGVALLCGLLWLLIIPAKVCYEGHSRLQLYAYKDTLQLHLRKLEQSFDRQTYTELLEILTKPPAGLNTLILESPLFYSTSAAKRDTSQLAKLANIRGWALQEKAVKLMPMHWLAIVVMTLSSSACRKLNLMKWLRIEFTRI